MLIYICDDSDMDAKILSRYLQLYNEKYHATLDIQYYFSAQEMLNAYKTAVAKPDLIFLDVYMQEMDGVEAGKQLRELKSAARIIFSTSSQEHALAAFQMNADGYLHKPYTRQEFDYAMEKVQQLFVDSGKVLEISVSRVTVQIPYRDIRYIESGPHCVVIHAKQDCRSCISMTQIQDIFAKEQDFFCCGKSFLVHLPYVKELTETAIVMDKGEQLTIPVRLRRRVRTEYENYRFKGYADEGKN